KPLPQSRAQGGTQSPATWGARTAMGFMRRIFFLGPKRLNSFLQIKEFKRRCLDLLRKINARRTKGHWVQAIIFRASLDRYRSRKLSRKYVGGGGRVESRLRGAHERSVA